LHWFDEANIAMLIGIRNIAKQYIASENDELETGFFHTLKISILKENKKL